MGIPSADLTLARQRGYLVCWDRDFDRFSPAWIDERLAKGLPVAIVRRHTAARATVAWRAENIPMSHDELATWTISTYASALHGGATTCSINLEKGTYGIADAPLALALEVAKELVELAEGPRKEFAA